MQLLTSILQASWHLLLESSVYIIFGLVISGALKTLINPQAISHHLGQKRFKSVFKAAMIGIPLPLCSCGVVPTAMSLRKQGASKGASTAFMISTPESGVDSIAITYALLDPLMTVVRPAAAFTSAVIAGVMENILGRNEKEEQPTSPPATVAGAINPPCCGNDHSNNYTQAPNRFVSGIGNGMRYAVNDVWRDMAGWFFMGVFLAGVIMVVIPDDFFGQYLSGGLGSMLMMLVIGIPIYTCATSSTPIAAALILKGVSPGAALVFLLVGPATNITSLTVFWGVMGKRTTAIYLFVIAVTAVLFGLTVDQIYAVWELPVRAVIGQASEIIPVFLQISGALLLLGITIIQSLPALKNGSMRMLGVFKGKTDLETPLSDTNMRSCAKPT